MILVLPFPIIAPMKYLRRVLAYIRKADEKYDLIQKGDRIVIGVSGGKDSLCLLKSLAIYGFFANKEFTLLPVTLDLGFPGFDPGPIKDYAASLGLSLIVEDCHDVFEILRIQSKGKRLPCSICSRMKKAAINEAANRLQANKVAFAHHVDDAIETAFMNLIHGGRVATFEPKMRLERANITFIRPLCECFESDLSGMAREENLPVAARVCPNDGETERQWAKDWLSKLYASRPDAHLNAANALSNLEAFNLPMSHLRFGLGDGLSVAPLSTPELANEYAALSSKKGLKSLSNGLETYLFLDKGKAFGAVSFQMGKLEADIRLCEFDPKREEKAICCLIKAMAEAAYRRNPFTFVYSARNKKTARKAGFVLSRRPGGRQLLIKSN